VNDRQVQGAGTRSASTPRGPAGAGSQGTGGPRRTPTAPGQRAGRWTDPWLHCCRIASGRSRSRSRCRSIRRVGSGAPRGPPRGGPGMCKSVTTSVESSRVRSTMASGYASSRSATSRTDVSASCRRRHHHRHFHDVPLSKEMVREAGEALHERQRVRSQRATDLATRHASSPRVGGAVGAGRSVAAGRRCGAPKDASED
jgi:hypothetical protein